MLATGTITECPSLPRDLESRRLHCSERHELGVLNMAALNNGVLRTYTHINYVKAQVINPKTWQPLVPAL